MTEPASLSERIRQRLKDELRARRVSQRDLAKELTDTTGELWSQGRVQKVLTGQVSLHVDDAAAMATAIGLPFSEVVRDRGLEFYAEMTPSELRLLERLRSRPDALQAIMLLLDVARGTPTTKVQSRNPPRNPLGRPKLNSAPDNIRIR